MIKPKGHVMSSFCSTRLEGRDSFDLTRAEARIAGLVRPNDQHTGPVRVTRGFCRDYIGPRVVQLTSIDITPHDYPLVTDRSLLNPVRNDPQKNIDA